MGSERARSLRLSRTDWQTAIKCLKLSCPEMLFVGHLTVRLTAKLQAPNRSRAAPV
jgi:hypothetical protein